MANIDSCPHCNIKVMLSDDRVCPSCQTSFDVKPKDPFTADREAVPKAKISNRMFVFVTVLLIFVPLAAIMIGGWGHASTVSNAAKAKQRAIEHKKRVRKLKQQRGYADPYHSTTGIVSMPRPGLSNSERIQVYSWVWKMGLVLLLVSMVGLILFHKRYY